MKLETWSMVDVKVFYFLFFSSHPIWGKVCVFIIWWACTTHNKQQTTNNRQQTTNNNSKPTLHHWDTDGILIYLILAQSKCHTPTQSSQSLTQSHQSTTASNLCESETWRSEPELHPLPGPTATSSASQLACQRRPLRLPLEWPSLEWSYCKTREAGWWATVRTAGRWDCTALSSSQMWLRTTVASQGMSGWGLRRWWRDQRWTTTTNAVVGWTDG